MKPVKTLVMITFVAAVIAVMGAPQAAMAANVGTNAGVTVTNAVLVDYSVGGTGQPQLSTSVNFVVDNYVDLLAGQNNGGVATTGRPGATVLFMFTVSNTGNTTQDYALIAADASTTWLAANNGATAFTYSVFRESGANGGYQPAEDIDDFIDELAYDTSATVYVVTTVPGSAVGGDYQNFSLTAVTHDAGAAGLGILTAETAGPNQPMVVNAVFADLSGPSDTDYDGTYSALGAFEVVWTDLTVLKTFQVMEDPFTGVSPNAKAIPGARVRYTITVTNNGNLAADDVQVVDTLPAELDLVLPIFSHNGDADASTLNDVDVTDTSLTGGGATFDVVYDAIIQ